MGGMNNPRRHLHPWSIWGIYVLLFFVAVPWYWPREDRTIWLGMPAWVVVAILGSAVISTFTAWVLHRPWPDEDDDPLEKGEQ